MEGQSIAVVSASATQMDLAEAQVLVDEKRRKLELLESEKIRLLEAFRDDITEMRAAAALRRLPLEQRLERLRDVERAEEDVREIRLKRQLEKLREDIFGTKPKIGPIQILPAEMLSNIFEHYVSLNQSPWCLVKVYRRWMDIALMTRRLWSYILVTGGAAIARRDARRHAQSEYSLSSWIFDGIEYLSRGTMQLCFTLQDVQAALARSGAAPLAIRIDSDIRHTKHGKSPLNRELLSIISLLTDESTSHRLQSLEIWGTDIPETQSLPPLVPGRFPNLNHIGWVGQISPWTNPLFEAVSSTSANLEVVHLGCALTPELTKLALWSRVKEVHLLKSDDRNRIPELNKIADKLENLETSNAVPLSWPNQATPTSTWRKVKQITLKCSPMDLARLQLPGLEHLRIQNIPLSYDNIHLAHREHSNNHPRFSYQDLSSLVLTTCDPCWLSNVSMPFLTKLEMNFSLSRGTTEDAILFSGLSFPSVEELTLGSTWHDNAAIACLQSTQNILVLRLRGASVGLQEIQRLTVLERLRDSEQMLCPQLKMLWLGDASSPIILLKANVVPVAKRLVVSRKKMGKALEKFEVQWCKTRKGTLIQQFA